jgi:type IV pilus assembly protein PilC
MTVLGADNAMIQIGGPAAALVALALVAATAAGDRPRGSRAGVQLLLGILSWTALGGLGLVLVGLGLVYGFMPGVVLLVVSVFVFHRWHTARQRAFLWTLHTAVRRRMPLGPAVRAFSEERSGITAYQASRLADMLEEGVPLPLALEHSRQLVPAEARAILRVGYESGNLATALAQVVEARLDHEPFWTPVLGRVLYVLAVLLALFLVVTFMSLKIAPAFQAIFDDFGAELPAMTVATLAATSFIGSYWYLLAAPLVLLVLPLATYGLLRLLGLVGPGLPGFNWLSRRLQTASLLEALSLAAERGRPIPEALRTLADCSPGIVPRRHLEQVLADVEEGAPWCESLHAWGLIRRADRAVLEAAQRTGHLHWAMREMADSSRRRHVYRAQLWMQVLFPAAVVLVGCVIGFLVISYFLPLIRLIQGLT